MRTLSSSYLGGVWGRTSRTTTIHLGETSCLMQDVLVGLLSNNTLLLLFLHFLRCMHLADLQSRRRGLYINCLNLSPSFPHCCLSLSPQPQIATVHENFRHHLNCLLSVAFKPPLAIDIQRPGNISARRHDRCESCCPGIFFGKKDPCLEEEQTWKSVPCSICVALSSVLIRARETHGAKAAKRLSKG